MKEEERGYYNKLLFLLVNTKFTLSDKGMASFLPEEWNPQIPRPLAHDHTSKGVRMTQCIKCTYVPHSKIGKIGQGTLQYPVRMENYTRNRNKIKIPNTLNSK